MSVAARTGHKPSATYVAAADAACDEQCEITLHHVGRHTDACCAQWNMVLDALIRADDEPLQGPVERPADWTDDAPTASRPVPTWAHVMAWAVIVWTATVAVMLVLAVAGGDLGHAHSAPAPAPVSTPQNAVCGSDAECAVRDYQRGISPAPDLTRAPDDMCPAGWTVVGIDDDTVPAACVPADLTTV